jgi:hypothetical protein
MPQAAHRWRGRQCHHCGCPLLLPPPPRVACTRPCVCVLPLFLPCSLGQNLAKLELQVVLAMLLARFCFSPGPQLQAEVDAARQAGQPPITAVYARAEVHVTLQPAGGQMMLFARQR